MKRAYLLLVVAQLAAAPGFSAELLDSFNPAPQGSIVGIAVDPDSQNLVIYREFGGAIINVIDQTGTEVGTIASPGPSSNDYDLDYAAGEMTIGGTVVPSGTLLVFNGDQSPETLYAVDDSGVVLASVALASASLVGGTHIPFTNSVATVDFTGSDFIRILDADTGAETGSFFPGPQPFDIFYGDLDISSVSDEITVVSSSQNIIRQLTPEGFCVRELDVGPFGIAGMSGVAINDTTGNLWISSTNGSVYHLDPRPDVGDTDGDGLLDFEDNCIAAANPNQDDSDGDGIGNSCDADIAGTNGDDCVVNFLDLTALSAAFLSSPGDTNWNPNADLSSATGEPDGVVNFLDFSRMADLFFEAPGPSGRGNICTCGL